jgi:Putative adhesin
MRCPSRPIAMAATRQPAVSPRPVSIRTGVACVGRLALVAALAAGATGCVVRVDSDGFRLREEKRFTTKGRPTVQLATFDGAIVIRGWDRDEISVEIEKRGRDKAAAEAIEVVADQKGDVVHVEARKKDFGEDRSYGIGWNGVSRSAKLVVSVPTGSNLVVRTGDGSIRVEHVNGKVELRSGDGSVTGRDLVGDVVAHTEDGAIRLEGIDGKCDVASDDGSIAVQGRLEALRVSAEDGSVVVRASAGSRISRDWSLSTGDGSMTLYLADGLGADLDAQANDGSVKLDSGLSFERLAGDDHSRSSVRGRLGAGGPRLVLRSGDGTIRLRRLPGGPMPPVPPVPPVPPADLPVER